MATKKEMAEQLGLDPADYSHAELVELVRLAASVSETMQEARESSGLKQHEIVALERVVRKAVKRDGGFRKGINRADRAAAIKALAALGRSEPMWDRSIDLGMINTKSVVKPKISKNSID